VGSGAVTLRSSKRNDHYVDKSDGGLNGFCGRSRYKRLLSLCFSNGPEEESGKKTNMNHNQCGYSLCLGDICANKQSMEYDWDMEMCGIHPDSVVIVCSIRILSNATHHKARTRS
jgi:hypothetical protein